MMENSTSTYDITRHLFETYYQSGETSPDDEFVSNHWMEERRLLKAVCDDDNPPTPSSEFSWGSSGQAYPEES